MSVASWCCKSFCVVRCVSFCTGHFVMVPLNMTYLHCLQHSLCEHLFNLYLYIHHIKDINFFWQESGIFWKITSPSETILHSRPLMLSLQVSWSKRNITRSLISLENNFGFLWEGRIEGQVICCRALWTRSVYK